MLSAICEPVLRPVRRIIPPVRVGGVGLDLSVMIVFLVVLVVLIPLFRESTASGPAGLGGRPEVRRRCLWRIPGPPGFRR